MKKVIIRESSNRMGGEVRVEGSGQIVETETDTRCKSVRI